MAHQPDTMMDTPSVDRTMEQKFGVANQKFVDDVSRFRGDSGLTEAPTSIQCKCIFPLECGGQVYTWIARSGVNGGHRFYKCVNKDRCGYMISCDCRLSSCPRAQLLANQLVAYCQVVPAHLPLAAYLHRRVIPGEPIEQ
ncbi:hypothetical protein TRIUR3_21558 [Triticum urartu]|uniref:Uncharacterized protein n=1 Tax=Triticum urartu TaxID=4572 RepID=M7Z7M4_TRIUA|nr:hypothetical protein TRIUR3_21558 [Triticum urartu]